MHYQIHPLPAGIDLAFLHQQNPARYPGLLASTASSNLNGRYDILPAFPQYQLRLDNNFSLSCDAALEFDRSSGFLESFERCWQREVLATVTQADLPFHGGWFVFLAYELASEVEPSLKLHPLPAGFPVAVAWRCPAALIHDRYTGHYYAVVENEYADILPLLKADAAHHARCASHNTNVYHVIEEGDEGSYLRQVARIKQYIVDGDIFQANLSREWCLTIDADTRDASLFAQLSVSNPGSFAAMCNLGEISILSSSPERLITVRDGIAQTRPIAGTRPRSDNDYTDTMLADELLRHPKEQAEHIMLIDLERNDLGRVCVPGSIEVNEMMSLETYQHVHHIVSNIRGRLRTDVTPADVIRAVFPGGTITGCPKVRCMEILADMERQARGAYTGSLGYINRDGSMDLNILIRTMTRKANKIYLRAGGGIVADSDARAELEETRAKAKGLLSAFRRATSVCNA